MKGVELMGLPVASVTRDEVVSELVDAARSGRGGWLITAHLDILRQFTRSTEVQEIVREATLVTADGMPLVWAARLAGQPLPERVAGSDLLDSLCGRAAEAGLAVFLLGGAGGVAERAADVLHTRHHGLRIVGTLSPPLGFERNPRELAEIVDAVSSVSPDIVAVALGFPKQERIIQRLRARRPEACYLGVGITFSFLTGDVRRAPPLLRRVGLEWLHRLLQEPRRLARRYLAQGLPFAAVLLGHALALRLRHAGRGSACSAP